MKYRAVVEPDDDTATRLEVPDDVIRQLDSGHRPPVVIGVGPHSFRTTVTPVGERYLVPLTEQDREAAGVRVGDYVTVDIELDRG